MSSKGKDETEQVLKDRIEQVKSQVGQDMEIPFEQEKFAPKFQEWIDSYEHDVTTYKEILADENAPEELRRLLAGALMYLVRQIDLVPDYYKPAGTIDDAMVLRVMADLGGEYAAELEPKHMKALFKLANDCETIREFLGDQYRDLENYVRLQPEKATHGLTGEAVAKEKSQMEELIRQVDEELHHFEAVAIQDGAKVERELHSYLHSKLKS